MAKRPHVVVLPFPVQGHINPMIQFSKRLASKGIQVTFLALPSTCQTLQNQSSSIQIEAIPDGNDADVKSQGLDDFIQSFRSSVVNNFTKFIEEKASSGQPVNALVYDSFTPWVLDLAHDLGLKAAAFFTHSCAVSAIYYHTYNGLLKVPSVEGSVISLPALPPLTRNDLPSFISNMDSYPSLLKQVLDRSINFDKADMLLFNSFDSLEYEVVQWMRSRWSTLTVGPTLPSMFLDKQLEDDIDYGLSLFKPDFETCMNWLDSKEIDSVVYVSFGSLASIGDTQMQEIACGLENTGCNFLWVVRSSEQPKLPDSFISRLCEKGLIVNWCPQLEVLSHKSVGCFLTHCGLNSTLEALSLGVPMLAMPQWTDQTTNAKFIVDIWQVGTRIHAGQRGTVTRDEVEMRIKEVMLGERGVKLKENALKWAKLAKEAVIEGGSSDKNIHDFASGLM